MTALTNNNKQSSAYKIDEFLVNKITLMAHQLNPHFWTYAVDYHKEKIDWKRINAINIYKNNLGYCITTFYNNSYINRLETASMYFCNNKTTDVDTLAKMTIENPDIDVYFCKVSGDLFMPCNDELNHRHTEE